MSATLSEQLTRKKPMAAKKGPHHGPDLGRSFGTFQLTMFGVGATVGTGIFFVLHEAVPDAGGESDVVVTTTNYAPTAGRTT